MLRMLVDYKQLFTVIIHMIMIVEIDPDRYEFCFSYDRSESRGKLFICDNKSEDLCDWRTALCYGEYAEVTAFRNEIRQFVSDESDKLKSNTLEFSKRIFKDIIEAINNEHST